MYFAPAASLLIGIPLTWRWKVQTGAALDDMEHSLDELLRSQLHWSLRVPWIGSLISVLNREPR